ncbi:MAG: CBS domain-containing protein [Gammaproteobacteria bacterium]|jgi:signal-transduction protein with cAMP-binding, CBS, and nucleotidyltransferase domain|nr:CBS domain-containing protein [Gammaproteobacteria bacterium]
MNNRKIVRVRDVMQKEYDVVDGMLTVKDALQAMQHPDNKCMIVEKRHEDDEFGLLLISDVARMVLAQDRAADRVNVYEVMQKPVIAVDPGMNIRYCARLLDRFSITRTPVIENDKVVGIVGFTDLVMIGMREGWQNA